MAKSALKEYRAKRDFAKTAEPSGSEKSARHGAPGLRYLIQKHDATRLHYDFRLEHEGVLLSWAVTRGPSFDPHDKRLAVHVEDHPFDYGDFEGTIPKGEYGGGTVMLWDEGTWEPLGDVDEGLKKGDLKFVLYGERLKGKWVLVRMKPRPGERSKHENWLLIKEHDQFAGPEKKPLIERALKSVRSGRSMVEIAAGKLEWTKTGPRIKADGRAGEGAGKGGRSRTAKAPKARALPKFVTPQLCTLVDVPPDGKDWLHEVKYDGYRVLAAIASGKVVIYTRKGLDWTETFRRLVQPLADLPCEAALLDGEIAVADKDGRTDFSALQAALSAGAGDLGYYLFDLLSLDGEDIRALPLVERKEKLAALLADQPRSGPLFYSDHIAGNGRETLKHACGLKLEGIVSKRADTPYRSGRSKAWLKAKCGMGQEFVVIGWKESEVKGRPFSSILLAVREEGQLSYRGRVGSGFGDAELARLWPELKKRGIAKPPADDVPAEAKRQAHFVKPELVAEIAFRGFTGDGLVRQGSYKGLRQDKKPAEIVAERPAAGEVVAKHAPTAPKKETKAMAVIASAKSGAWVEVAGVRLTHPDRILFPGEGITKQMLAEYYVGVADRILRHVAGRPLSLVRCPAGAGGDCFFQKHASAGFPEALKRVRIKETSSGDEYLYVDDLAGLISTVQMGALELHVWGSHVTSLEKPDRVVFDFDPDEEIDFDLVRAAAVEMRERLSALGLESFAMASGGKGLHVVVPLASRDGWDAVKNFAEAMARILAADRPDRYLAVASKAQRKGRIFIDYLRNGRGATAIAPFSCRARKGAAVAWPVAWSALAKLESAHPASVVTAAGLLKKQKKDPWAGYFDVEQVLPKAASAAR